MRKSRWNAESWARGDNIVTSSPTLALNRRDPSPWVVREPYVMHAHSVRRPHGQVLLNVQTAQLFDDISAGLIMLKGLS